MMNFSKNNLTLLNKEDLLQINGGEDCGTFLEGFVEGFVSTFKFLRDLIKSQS